MTVVDSTRVLSAVRNELVTAGIVRKPGVAGVLVPLHVDPEGGAPGPGERPSPEADGNVVATVRLSSEAPRGLGERYRRIYVLDFLYRSDTTGGLQRARQLHELIVRHLVDRTEPGLGATLDAAGPASTSMLSSSVFAGLGPLDDGANGTRTDIAKIAVEVLAS